jgi:hypothetical protein
MVPTRPWAGTSVSTDRPHLGSQTRIRGDGRELEIRDDVTAGPSDHPKWEFRARGSNRDVTVVGEERLGQKVALDRVCRQGLGS